MKLKAKFEGPSIAVAGVGEFKPGQVVNVDDDQVSTYLSTGVFFPDYRETTGPDADPDRHDGAGQARGKKR